ncbi:hypothetical protein [Glaciecola sp. KUL10]|uniref:hypothetical protein n=1 Tax=Glaciecola sp. (strain KUL10) TaxID=2161813 RepID=UPI000D785692|nr:hypothetical protein [Glaciecola sp. KUL10]GBL03507.1 hypothetical protein KUL10_08070 [Glaciecola sp. KUL10]
MKRFISTLVVAFSLIFLASCQQHNFSTKDRFFSARAIEVCEDAIREKSPSYRAHERFNSPLRTATFIYSNVNPYIKIKIGLLPQSIENPPPLISSDYAFFCSLDIGDAPQIISLVGPDGPNSNGLETYVDNIDQAYIDEFEKYKAYIMSGGEEQLKRFTFVIKNGEWVPIEE